MNKIHEWSFTSYKCFIHNNIFFFKKDFIKLKKKKLALEGWLKW